MKKSLSFCFAIFGTWLLISCNKNECLHCSSCVGCEDLQVICRDKYERNPHVISWEEYVHQRTTDQPGEPALCSKAD